MKKNKKGNLQFLDPMSDRLIFRARHGSLEARRQLLQVVADQAVPDGDLPNPIQSFIKNAFSKAAQAAHPENELLKELGLRVAGRPRVELTEEQENAIFSLASELYGENWRRATGCRMSKSCSTLRNQLANSIGITNSALDKILDDWVTGFERDAALKRLERG
jgi:hypothetical protein